MFIISLIFSLDSKINSFLLNRILPQKLEMDVKLDQMLQLEKMLLLKMESDFLTAVSWIIQQLNQILGFHNQLLVGDVLLEDGFEFILFI